MFVLSMRTSTWVAVLAFIVLTGIRRDDRALAAGWVWLTGFEAAFQATGLLFGRADEISGGYVSGLLIAFGVFTVAWFARHGVHPSKRWMLLVAVLWLLWMVTGFHANSHTMVGLDPFAEAVNEATKTAWAAAYLWPLIPRRAVGGTGSGRDRRRSPAHVPSLRASPPARSEH